MPRFDIYKTLSQTGNTLKQLSVFNPLTIHKKGKRAKAIFALTLVCFLWGTTWLASKEGVKRMPALQLAGIRQVIAGSIYVIFFLIKGMKLPGKKDWIPILVLSFLNFVMSNGLTTWAVQYISAGLGAIMGAIFPIWIVVIGLFSMKEKIPGKAIIGLILGFGGVCIIFYEHLQDFLNADFRFGIFLSLVATWTWAFGTLYTKKEAVRFNPYFSLGLQMLISGVALVFFTKATGNAVALTQIPWQSWASISYLVIFGSLIAFVAYLYALQNLPTEQASIYAYINPVVAVLLGWLIFNEKLTVFIGLGGLVALMGVFLVNKAFKAVPAIEQPETEGI
ncbi:MAG: EamA family transporter [Bacteroidia bacterium]|nr:EamA family transporter [Bacteroidia bacterium]